MSSPLAVDNDLISCFSPRSLAQMGVRGLMQTHNKQIDPHSGTFLFLFSNKRAIWHSNPLLFYLQQALSACCHNTSLKKPFFTALLPSSFFFCVSFWMWGVAVWQCDWAVTRFLLGASWTNKSKHLLRSRHNLQVSFHLSLSPLGVFRWRPSRSFLLFLLLLLPAVNDVRL